MLYCQSLSSLKPRGTYIYNNCLPWDRNPEIQGNLTSPGAQIQVCTYVVHRVSDELNYIKLGCTHDVAPGEVELYQDSSVHTEVPGTQGTYPFRLFSGVINI